MFKRSEPPTLSRLYVDTMYPKDHFYAPPEPEITINIGDYGTVDPETGDWMHSGNIYKEKLLGGVPKIGSPGGLQSYVAGSVDSFTVGADITTAFPELVNCAFKTRYKFGKYVGAALIYYDYQIQHIPNSRESLKALVGHPKLCDYAIATKVYHCSHYAMALGNSKHHDIGIGIKASVGGSPVKVLTGGPEISWISSGTTSRMKFSPEPSSPYAYTVLVRLNSLKKPDSAPVQVVRMGSKVDEDSDELPCYALPWGRLDNQGNLVPPPVDLITSKSEVHKDD